MLDSELIQQLQGEVEGLDVSSLSELSDTLKSIREEVRQEFIKRALAGDSEAQESLEGHGFDSKALYTGTFDPFTNGHLNIAIRGSKLFSSVTIAVGVNPAKTPLFPPEERVQLIKDAVKDYPNIRVISFKDGSAHRAEIEDCNVIIRGVREVTDFIKELSEANLNSDLSLGNVETIFIPTTPTQANLSSTMVKALTQAFYGVSEYLPANIAEKLREKIALQSLEKRFADIVTPLTEESSEVVKEKFYEVANHYLENNRCHHSLWHLHEMFLILDRNDALKNNPTLALAIFGHDLIYEVGCDDNEKASAKEFKDIIKTLEIDESILKEVDRLIILSEDHKVEDGDILGGVFCDLDLAILSAPANRYREYVSFIRSEYTAIFSVKSYLTGRKDFLNRMKGKQIFSGPEKFGLSERIVQKNILSELAMIEKEMLDN